MLVLSRKQDEKIVINGNIVVTVVSIVGDKVRLGIEAPMTVPVHRQEIHDALQRAAQESAESAESAESPSDSTDAAAE